MNQRSSAVGCRGSQRPLIERMIDLAAMLRAGRPVNAKIAAKKWEVSPKTIARDLEFMRDRLGYDITYVADKHTYALCKAPTPQL